MSKYVNSRLLKTQRERLGIMSAITGRSMQSMVDEAVLKWMMNNPVPADVFKKAMANLLEADNSNTQGK